MVKVIYWVVGILIIAFILVIVSIIKSKNNGKGDSNREIDYGTQGYTERKSENPNEDTDADEENYADTFIDLIDGCSIGGEGEVIIKGDTITKCCYYYHYSDDKIMSPVFKPDGSIYTIEELEPLLRIH